MLRRLELLNGGGISNGLENKRAADLRAERLGPTIRKLRKAGIVSIKAIAGALNERGIAAPRGGKWHLTTITGMLERLERLDRAPEWQTSPLGPFFSPVESDLARGW